MSDFTLKAYLNVLKASKSAGYKSYTVKQWLEMTTPNHKNALVLRHDVDRKPKNALLMARGEYELGIQSTYYFRIVKSSFNIAIIEEIASLGHEIGYHYEDFYTAKYDTALAFELYKKNLMVLRAVAPIDTIAMHGSPLSKFSNMEIWKQNKFEETNVKDCILSYDWSDFIFFTDTGRTFGKTLANLRDTINSKTIDEVKSSKDIENYLSKNPNALIQFSTHPERWDSSFSSWCIQATKDTAINAIKRCIRIMYGAKLRKSY